MMPNKLAIVCEKDETEVVSFHLCNIRSRKFCNVYTKVKMEVFNQGIPLYAMTNESGWTCNMNFSTAKVDIGLTGLEDSVIY